MPEPDDFDARFREIVAHFDDPASEPVRRAPEARQPSEPPPKPPEPRPIIVPDQWRMPPARSGGSSSVLDEHSTFEPPDPALPQGDPTFYAIIAGLVCGPLWMLYLFFFDRYARPLWWWCAAGMTLAALVGLFLRQPPTREDPDDDGAVL